MVGKASQNAPQRSNSPGASHWGGASLGPSRTTPKEPNQNTVVQSIELQGNGDGTGKSRQNSSGTGIAKLAVAAPTMTVQLTANTGVVPLKKVPPSQSDVSVERRYRNS